MRAATARVPIEFLCARVTSGGTPSRANPSFWEHGTVPWIKTGELKDWYIDDAEERITEEAVLRSSAKVFPANTVLMAMYGDGKTITSLGIIRNAAATNQACCAMIADPKRCHFLYLFYALKYHRHELLKLVVAGAQRNLSGGIIRTFKVLAPGLATQRRIADVLSNYDDLVETNRRRMALLEKAARLLYEEWFVHLRFPGHERTRMIDGLPQGWQQVPFSALADFVNGYPFKPEDLGDGGLPIVKIPELRAGISPKTPRNTGENIPEKYLLQDGDLLFSWSGTLLVEFWYDGPAILNQHLFRVETKASCAPVFMLQALRRALPEFANQTTGATLKHIRKSALTTVKTILPPRALLTHFDEFASMVYRQILNLRRQNSNLVKARDILLPRLMSGEIAV
jgi:type I restriction enzyme S subunit